MSLSREDAARKLGMKLDEVVGVAEENGVAVVTLHDGTVNEIDGDRITTRPRTATDADRDRAGAGGPVVAEVTSDGPRVVDDGDGDSAAVTQALAYAPAGEVRADTPPRDPRLDGEVTGALDDDELDADADFTEDDDDEHQVPDATSDVVLNWVNSDPERARRALEHENRRERPRKTLVAELDKLSKG